MRKITALILSLIMLLTATAFAEAAWVEMDLGDFTISIPEDILGTIEEEITPEVTFATFYEDYDETKPFTKNLGIVFTAEVLDLNAATAEEYAQAISSSAAAQFSAIGIESTAPTVLQADFDQQDGKDALFVLFSTDLDYTNAGVDLQMTMYTIQMIVPDEAFGGSYIFTISTDNLEETDILIKVADSVTWKK